MLLVEISIEYLNIDHILPECAIKLYYCLVPRGICSKIFCRVLHLINSLQSANVLIKQTAKQYKYYMTKIQEKSFCYIYHVVQVNIIDKMLLFLLISVEVVPGSWTNHTRSDLKGGGANPVP